jgi:hypothetical protein
MVYACDPPLGSEGIKLVGQTRSEAFRGIQLKLAMPVPHPTPWIQTV